MLRIEKVCSYARNGAADDGFAVLVGGTPPDSGKACPHSREGGGSCLSHCFLVPKEAVEKIISETETPFQK